ncbi:putative GNAT family acetyltransferase [Hymenobacter sp. UYAg731]
MPMPIQHDTENQEFTLSQDGHTGKLAYTRPAEGVIDFTHTFVDEALRGQGLADELARAALAYARDQKLKVKTSCEFMAGFVQKHHAEYADLLA